MLRDISTRLSLGRRRLIALRMAPMIDIIFLLLIFFLVSAKWRPEENFLPLKLSTTQLQEAVLVKPEPLAIYISPTQTGCQVQIGQLRTVRIEDKDIDTNLAALMEEIDNCLAAQRRFTTDPVEIICDAQVKWEHLAKIYNVFYGAGLTDITFQMTE
jgi:biopolymer transport protein ExbD